MSTLYLNPTTWDLDIDADGNIAVATGGYALAQDVACALKTFAGEVWYDTTLGVPYLTDILGKSPPVALLKARFEAAALTQPGVTKARVFISSMADDTVAGQVQVTDATGATTLAAF